MKILNVNPNELINIDVLEAANILSWEDEQSIGFYDHVKFT